MCFVLTPWGVKGLSFFYVEIPLGTYEQFIKKYIYTKCQKLKRGKLLLKISAMNFSSLELRWSGNM